MYLRQDAIRAQVRAKGRSKLGKVGQVSAGRVREVVGRRGDDSSARVSAGRERWVGVRQSEVDCSTPSNVGDGQGGSEDPPLGPAGRSKVPAVPSCRDTGPSRGPPLQE